MTVFCGSRKGTRDIFVSAAEETGRAIARAGAGIVFGGGHVGLMGVLADAALAEGAPVIGVIPESLFAKELAHKGLSQIHVVGSMHARKALMAEHAKGFLVLPGGFGTMDEFFEILTWRQLGFHARPIVVLNTSGFFDPLLAMMARMEEEMFAPPVSGFVAVTKTPSEAVAAALERN